MKHPLIATEKNLTYDLRDLGPTSFVHLRLHGSVVISAWSIKAIKLKLFKKRSGASIEIDQPEEEGEQTIKTLRSAYITHDFHYAAKSTQLASSPIAQRRQSRVCHAQ